MHLAYIFAIHQVAGALAARTHPNHLPDQTHRGLFTCRLPTTRII